MDKYSTRTICALSLALFSLVSAPEPQPIPTAPSTAPVVGPGGIRFAVQDILKALDRADSKVLRTSLVTSRAGWEWREGGEDVGAPASTAFDFFDVGHDRAPWAADAVDKLVEGAKTSLLGAGGVRPKSTMRRIFADCPSARCSYALFEFDRSWGDGAKATVIPMRGTAIFEHSDTRKGGSEFRLMHWHAAPRD